MNNPVRSLLDQYAGVKALPRLKSVVVGLAQDFWNDGPENPLKTFKMSDVVTLARHITHFGSRVHKEPAVSPFRAAVQAAESEKVSPVFNHWHAAPGEVLEKMWGAGYVMPADNVISEMLLLPLLVNKDMSVLDLSAGLGTQLRHTVDKLGVYITGLESNPEIAIRGMEISMRTGKGKRAVIAAYDPDNFSHTKKYDCIIARELFYRVVDKGVFFRALANCSKPKAQFSFTDYILEPAYRDNAAIKAWQEHENHAAPLSLKEMTEAWAKVGYVVRVKDDQSTLYRKEVLQGFARLAEFLKTSLPPDADSKKEVRHILDTWAHRMGAFEQGMCFYRFFAIKEG